MVGPWQLLISIQKPRQELKADLTPFPGLFRISKSLRPHRYAGRAAGHADFTEADEDSIRRRIETNIASARNKDPKRRRRAGVDRRRYAAAR